MYTKREFCLYKSTFSLPAELGRLPVYRTSEYRSCSKQLLFPLYEIDNGNIKVTYNPEKSNRKCDVSKWFSYMKRTRYLLEEEHSETLKNIQSDVDKRWKTLLSLAEWSKNN